MLEAEPAGESKGEAETELAVESAVMFLFSTGCWARAVEVAMVGEVVVWWWRGKRVWVGSKPEQLQHKRAINC